MHNTSGVASLFDPLTLRGATLKNRVVVSPMCQYSCTDGLPTDWHLVHLGQFALGGAALVITEATAVSPEGRISPDDAGIWTDEQAERWSRVIRFLHEHDALAGVQLAHAGRKASTYRPGHERRGTVPPEDGGWTALGPSAIAFGRYAVPAALDADGIAKVRQDFVAAARRAAAVGFDAVELHGAHGYLLHEFLSPLANERTDSYGGGFEGRTRLLREVVDDVRAAFGGLLLVRISGDDWTPGGWTVEESARLAPLLHAAGVDLIDVSSGGLHHEQQITVGPGYQVPFSRALKAVGATTGAVGLITDPEQADAIVRDGDADVVLLARELLRDPHWPLRAARELGVDIAWPRQYDRAKL
ncbi:MAG: NADH-dependent flavin oxidoreductase [Frankiales bacterium]|nr:NADH-dependent flavin oxidoreductase [Frankiales bacterium]